jgi:hypothetical protein
MKYVISVLLLSVLSMPLFAELPVGKKPPEIVLSGDLGARVNGTPWSSSEIKGKVFTMFYVDPDEKDLNDHVSKRLKKEKFPKEKVGSIAIINMDASWAPNFAIESSLEDKQKEYPTTIYVKDFEKVLVDKWKLTDDSSDVLAFDKTGKVIFSKDGKLSDADVEKLLQAIRDNM